MLTSSLQFMVSGGAFCENVSRKIKKTGKNPDIEYQKNIRIQNKNGSALYMDVFKPKTDPSEKLPVIVHLRCDSFIYGDRKRSRRFAEILAEQGYLVFCIDYRPMFEADLRKQLKDVAAGLKAVSKQLQEYDVDESRVFMTADPTAGFLALYTSAMFRSEKLREAIGCKTPGMDFKAVGISSGFFYLKRNDVYGVVCSDMYVSSEKMDMRMLMYMDPEHLDIIRNIPPVFMVTSSCDILQNDTLKLGKKLQEETKTYKIINYNSDNADHAFLVRDPDGKRSRKTISRMLSWFEEMAEKRREADKLLEEQQKTLDEVDRRIADGSIIHQKLWSFLEEINSATEERLEATAIVAAYRKYTYRQFFQEIRRYAKVFSALKMTGENKSRVAFIGGSEPETFMNFYGMNMTGARISGISMLEFLNFERLKKMVDTEGINDVIVSCVCANVHELAALYREKESLGLRNILLYRSVKSPVCCTKAEQMLYEMKISAIKALPEAVFINDLFDRYESTPISFEEYEPEKVTVVLHTSGTTKGVSKPIPYTDSEINAGALHFLQGDLFRPKAPNDVSLHCLPDTSACYATVDQMHMPLAFGCTIVPTDMAFLRVDVIPGIIKHYNVNFLMLNAVVMEALLRRGLMPDNYYSSLDIIALGGTYLSTTDRRRYSNYLKRYGSRVGITNGYGLSEACGACVISPDGSDDDTIGYPLPGMYFLLKDEDTGEYRTIEEGPCTGVLYVSSESVSCGKLDGETIIEHFQIGDKDYICTYDLIKVNENGSLTYVGRENRFFVNNSGVKFKAGPAETKITAQPTVENCAFVPYYDKWAHDTVPMLCVKFGKQVTDAEQESIRILTEVFLKDEDMRDSSLPCNVLIADEIPYNTNGKVNVYKVTSGMVNGQLYQVKMEWDGDTITSLSLEKVNRAKFGNHGYMKGNTTVDL